jgi:hypothetical protein
MSYPFVKVAGSLVPEEFDAIALTYVSGGDADGEINTVVYSLNGTTIATLTMTYTGAILTGVAKT